ncbi:hypothetical protein OG216_45595 [Streptomycetaceae bacterium NBC_01309]
MGTQVVGLVERGDADAGLGFDTGFEEELPEAGGGEDDELLDRVQAGVAEVVHGSRGDVDEVSRLDVVGVSCGPDFQLPVEDVEGFVFTSVAVRGRAAAGGTVTSSNIMAHAVPQEQVAGREPVGPGAPGVEHPVLFGGAVEVVAAGAQAGVDDGAASCMKGPAVLQTRVRPSNRRARSSVVCGTSTDWHDADLD